jgi:hypothetical protein
LPYGFYFLVLVVIGSCGGVWNVTFFHSHFGRLRLIWIIIAVLSDVRGFGASLCPAVTIPDYQAALAPSDQSVFRTFSRFTSSPRSKGNLYGSPEPSLLILHYRIHQLKKEVKRIFNSEF